MDSEAAKLRQLVRRRLNALGKPVTLRLNQVAIWLEITPTEARELLSGLERLGLVVRTDNTWETRQQPPRKQAVNNEPTSLIETADL